MAASTIAGSYPQRFPLEITCILKEGNITVVDSGSALSALGDTAANYTLAAQLYENDVVALSNDVLNVYDTVGIPVVEKMVNTESLVFGKLVSAPDMMENVPAATETSWANMLANKNYRIAKVEVWMGITKIEDAVVTTTNNNSVAIGVGATLNVDLGECYANHDLRFVTAAANGVGVIPLHYLAHGGGGVVGTILVGITGPMYSVT